MISRDPLSYPHWNLAQPIIAKGVEGVGVGGEGGGGEAIPAYRHP